MEKQLAQFPTISDAIKMKDFELERLQKKNEVSWFPPFPNWIELKCILLLQGKKNSSRKEMKKKTHFDGLDQVPAFAFIK